MIVLPAYSDPSAATPAPSPRPGATGQGLIQLGRSLRHVGATAGHLAADLRATEDSAALSEAKLNLAGLQARFEDSLHQDHDHSKYQNRLENEVIAPAYHLISPDLSPDARQRLRQDIDQWASDLRIGTQRTARLKSIDRAKTHLQAAEEAFVETGDLDGYLRLLDQQAWLAPEEKDRLVGRATVLHERRQIERRIIDDPAAYLESPITSADPALDRARTTLARTTLRTRTAEDTDQAIDLILTDKIGTPEDIDRLFPELRPAARAELADFLQRHEQGLADQARRDPDVMHALAGEISSSISSYDPSLEGFDSGYVAIATRISQLPPSPLRSELERNLKNIRTDAYQAVDTNEEAAFKALDQAFKDGGFGPVEQKTDVLPFIDAGLLDDSKKLRTLGFSTAQAKAIAGKKGTAQRAEFRRLWHQREDAANALTGTSIFPVAEAYALRQTSIDLLDDTGRRSTLQAYGEAKSELADWLQANPDKARDPEAVNSKVLDIGIRTDVREILKRALPPRPAPAGASLSLPAPLQPLGPAFKKYGDQYGVDPRFLAAISRLETANGTSSAFRTKRNAMGVSNASGPISFTTPEGSIARMARVLADPKGPYRNASTLAEIGKIYAPPGASNDVHGTNSTWAAGVAKYLRQMGVADPYSIRLR